MASTNKTPNFELNQWVETDPVLREDFNADNAKIDAAIASTPWVKINDVITTEAAYEIDVDISGLNIRDYSGFRIYLDAYLSSASGSLTFGLLPKASSSHYSTSTYYSNLSSDNFTSTSDGTMLSMTEYNVEIRAIDMAFSNVNNRLIILSSCLYYFNGNYAKYTTGKATYSYIPQLTAIFFKRGSTSNSFPSGTRITVYGIRR